MDCPRGLVARNGIRVNRMEDDADQIRTSTKLKVLEKVEDTLRSNRLVVIDGYNIMPARVLDWDCLSDRRHGMNGRKNRKAI